MTNDVSVKTIFCGKFPPFAERWLLQWYDPTIGRHCEYVWHTLERIEKEAKSMEDKGYPYRILHIPATKEEFAMMPGSGIVSPAVSTITKEV